MLDEEFWFASHGFVSLPLTLFSLSSERRVFFDATELTQPQKKEKKQGKESEGMMASRLSSLSLLSVSPFLRRGVVFVIRVCLIFYFCSFPSFQNRKGGKGKRRQGCVRLVSLPLFSVSRYSPPSFFFFHPAETAKQREGERKERKY